MDINPQTGTAGHARGLGVAGRVLAGISCALLFVMMCLTFADVMGRYVFLSPLPAAYEIISLLMPAIIFCALPLTILRESHVTVDLLDSFVPRAVARVQGVVVSIVAAAALGLVTWRLVVKALDDLEYQTVTDELVLQLWPFSFGMAALCAIAAAASLANAWAYSAGHMNRG